MMKVTNNFKLCIAIVCLFLLASNSYGAELQRSTLQVANLSCPSCLGRIESELQKISGAVGMAADLQTGIVEVDHHSTLGAQDIADLMSGMGYGAEVSSTIMIEEEEALVFSHNTSTRSFCRIGGCRGSKDCGAAGSAWKELYKRFINKASQ